MPSIGDMVIRRPAVEGSHSAGCMIAVDDLSRGAVSYAAIPQKTSSRGYSMRSYGRPPVRRRLRSTLPACAESARR